MLSHDDIVFDTVSAEEQRDVAEKVAEIAKDYREVFETDAGRRVLADLSFRCMLNSPTYSQDPQRTTMNEGNREVVVEIMRMVLWGEKPNELVDAYMAVQKAEGMLGNGNR